MNSTFNFIGIISKDVTSTDIVSEIPIQIAYQQSQFKTGLGDDDPANIEVIEFAYVDAQPNCWLVHAKWKIK